MKRLAAAILLSALAACGGPEPEPVNDAASSRARTHQAFGFDQLDLNDDGSIAQSESTFDAALSRNFAKIDQDDDGKLSRLEFDVARAAAHAKRK